MLAAGSYSGSAALMDPRTRELLCLLEGGHAGGVTHVSRRRRLCCHHWLPPARCGVPNQLLSLDPTAGRRCPIACHVQLCFSADGNFLYTGARRDTTIRCWDVRYASGEWPPGGRHVDTCVSCCSHAYPCSDAGVVYSLERASGGTNQRMTFDVEPCGRHLATGGEDGLLRTFDLRDGSAAGQFAAADDTGALQCSMSRRQG